MWTLPSLLALVGGLLLELLAWLMLTNDWSAMAQLLVFLLLHAVASAGVMVFAWRALPQQYRWPARGPLLFLFSMGFCMPLLGFFGIGLGVLLALHWHKQARVQTWAASGIPELPYRPVEVDPDTVLRRGGLITVISHNEDADWRQRAVMACKHLPEREAIPILRTALADPADEVRLLANAELGNKERRIERRIEELLEQLEAKDAPWIHERLANLYWELSYLGLATGEVEGYVLEQSARHLELALGGRQTATGQFLRGRIRLHQGRLDEAREALLDAERLGIGADDVAPYLAELNWRSGRFDEVGSQLRRLSRQAAGRAPLLQLVEYWGKPHGI